MRRPLGAFCASALGVLLLCAFLPRAELFLLPSAAFFVLWAFPRGKTARTAALCLCTGAALGGLLFFKTNAQLRSVQSRFAGRTLLVCAEVESVTPSYYDDTVTAFLRAETAGDEAADFRFLCAGLPACAVGDRIAARFALETPPAELALERYADGAELEAEYAGGFRVLGEGGGFRARCARVQQTLSESLRRLLDENTGGVLAAMVLGDHGSLPAAMNSAYRAAGLSHVLVVSGMHVSLLCGDIFPRRRREQSYNSRRLRAVFRAVLALLLVGITGFTPSVLRAAAAVWISALGVWVFAPADPLTSLAAAGLGMSLVNGYAACDVGFELSFAAVIGTLAGAECADRGRELWAKKHLFRGGKTAIPRRILVKMGGSLWDTVCISLCASAATFPVLVLRGLSASAYALLSSVAVLWLVEPMMLFGIGASLAGLVPLAVPLHFVLSCGAGLAAYIMNRWAVMVAQWPGAQISFETAFSALVCLLLIVLCALAFHWRVRLRIAVPAVALALALALGVSAALDRGVVHVELVGSKNAPTAVITQNERAVVLFRGGASAQQAVEAVLTRRGVRIVELLIDLRLDPQTACTLTARQAVAASEMERGTTKNYVCRLTSAEIFRTREGCAVRLDLAGQQFAAVSGTVALARSVRADWLLASPSNPSALRWERVLSLSESYSWMEDTAANVAGSSLALRPGGGERVQR